MLVGMRTKYMIPKVIEWILTYLWLLNCCWRCCCFCSFCLFACFTIFIHVIEKVTSVMKLTIYIFCPVWSFLEKLTWNTSTDRFVGTTLSLWEQICKKGWRWSQKQYQAGTRQGSIWNCMHFRKSELVSLQRS